MKIFDGQKGKRCDENEYLTYTHKRCPVLLEIANALICERADPVERPKKAKGRA